MTDLRMIRMPLPRVVADWLFEKFTNDDESILEL